MPEMRCAAVLLAFGLGACGSSGAPVGAITPHSIAAAPAKSNAASALADYEALIAAATVVPSQSEGLKESARDTCTVGPSELDCVTKSYRARLDIIYRASLSEPGSDRPGTAELAPTPLR